MPGPEIQDIACTDLLLSSSQLGKSVLCPLLILLIMSALYITNLPSNEDASQMVTIINHIDDFSIVKVLSVIFVPVSFDRN